MFALIFLPLVATAYTCTDFAISFTLPFPSYELGIPVFADRYQAVALLGEATASNASTAASSPPIVNSITENLSISTEICLPENHKQINGVQVLTHGLGFDKSYWKVDGCYDYINAATEAGYATLAYDRVGNGHSTTVDPYQLQQAPLQLIVLATITEYLRNGTLHPLIPNDDTKVFHVGHSYGSILSHALAATYPNLTDGVILTGYSTDQSFTPEFLISTNFHLAKENQPWRFANRSTGALTWGDELANQYSFLAYPYFDPAVLEWAEANKYPFAIGEPLTLGALDFNATGFAKPVLIISGDSDRIFCGGDCVGVIEKAAPFFPTAKPFQTYIQPRTGHGINLHYNSSGAYDVIQNFLKTHG